MYGCFTDVADDISNYVSLLVVLFRDEALQLLSIVDHIFDWTRDQYTPSILHQSKSPSRSSSIEITTDGDDSDICLLRFLVETLAKGLLNARYCDFERNAENISHILATSSTGLAKRGLSMSLYYRFRVLDAPHYRRQRQYYASILLLLRPKPSYTLAKH